jgi:hypothetical protein
MAKLAALPAADQALPGRASPIPTATGHFSGYCGLGGTGVSCPVWALADAYSGTCSSEPPNAPG